MLIGGFFTLVGLVSLLTPGIPVICIGALILGPIELVMGLIGSSEPRPLTLPSLDHAAPVQLPTAGPTDSTPPVARVATRREFARVYVVVGIDRPARHEIVAGYEGETATVLVDGEVYAQFRRPLGGTRGTDVEFVLADRPEGKYTVWFWGWRAHVTVLYNGQVIGDV